MRKMTVEIRLKKEIADPARALYEKIESVRVLEILKMDFSSGQRAGISEIVMKEGHSLEEWLEDMSDYKPETLHVLKQDGNKYTVFSQVSTPDEYKHLVKEFDLNLIFVSPILKSAERVVTSCIGNEEDLRRYVALIKEHFGEIENIHLTKAMYKEHDILSCLTNKQKEIVILAKRYGYYAYPRKITTEKLAKKMGISRATLTEHLRKAEERLLSHLLAGY
jgi:predicted DNA binding protein